MLLFHVFLLFLFFCNLVLNPASALLSSDPHNSLILTWHESDGATLDTEHFYMHAY